LALALEEEYRLPDWRGYSDYDSLPNLDRKRIQVPGDNDNGSGIQNAIL